MTTNVQTTEGGFANIAKLIAAILLLETLVAALQAYVFALLASTFIGLMQHEHQ